MLKMDYKKEVTLGVSNPQAPESMLQPRAGYMHTVNGFQVLKILQAMSSM